MANPKSKTHNLFDLLRNDLPRFGVTFPDMNFALRFFFLLLVLSVAAPLWGQKPDSLRVVPDSSGVLPIKPVKNALLHRFLGKDYPNPRKAALLGLVFPGGGQIYNKRWWKLPLVYGAIGTALGFEIHNVREHRAARDNYKWAVDDDDLTNPVGKFAGRDATTLRSYRDTFRRYTELSAVALSLVYLLSISEAYVDAHLKDFDVNEDLSLHLRPSLQAAPGLGAAYGFGVCVQLK